MIRFIKRGWLSLVALILLFAMGTPVLAYTYYAFVNLTESAGNSYTMFPALVPNNTTWQITQGYVSATGLNTRVRTDGSTIPHMLADNKLLFAYPLPGNTTQPLRYTTGEAVLASFPIITGYGGYYYTTDVATMELANSFSLEWDGYIDTTAGTDKNLVYKKEAIRTFIDGASTITSGITTTTPILLTPSAYAGWVDVNVSQYLPIEATGVILHIKANTKDCGFRKNGSTDDRKTDFNHNWVMIGVDSSQIFEAYIEDNTCSMYLAGYTDSSWTYKTNATDVSIGAFGAWTDVDVTASTSASAVGVVLEIENLNGASQTAGVRKDGSTDARNGDIDLTSHLFVVIGLDTATEIFEMWAQSTDINTYLIGYVESGATLATDATDKSIAAAAWTDIDCSVEAPNADFLIFEAYETGGAGAYTYGLRKNGTTEALIEELNGRHAWVVVECDASQIVEGYVSDIAVDFFLVGYITSGAVPPFAASVAATPVASGEHTVTTTGIQNNPGWATASTMAFDGTVNGYLNCTDIAAYDTKTKYAVSLWFKPTNAHNAGSGNHAIYAKGNAAATIFTIIWLTNDGKLSWYVDNGGAGDLTLVSTQTSWSAGVWHHVVAGVNDVTGAFMIIDGGVPITSADTRGTGNAGVFTIGHYDNVGSLATAGFVGQVQNVSTFVDTLTDAEKAGLYLGIVPADAVDYWYIDEGTGNSVYSYGTGATTGTKAAGATWGTSTHTTGSTGRLCDFYIAVDGVNYQGLNLKAIDVPDNANTWYFTQGNVSPYLDYYKHTVGGTLIAWYQPNALISGTVLPDRQGAAENAVIVWGANPAGVSITMGSFTVASTATSTSEEVESVGAAGEINTGEDWYPGDSELTGIPFLRPTVHDLTIIVGDPEWLWWLFMAIVATILAMAVVFKYTQHLWFMCGAGIITLAGCAAAMMIQPAVIAVVIGILLLPMLMERKPSW